MVGRSVPTEAAVKRASKWQAFSRALAFTVLYCAFLVAGFFTAREVAGLRIVAAKTGLTSQQPVQKASLDSLLGSARHLTALHPERPTRLAATRIHTPGKGVGIIENSTHGEVHGHLREGGTLGTYSAEHPWVGRHKIPIRPWPHPLAHQTQLAHSLIAKIQAEQRKQFWPQSGQRVRVITVTPTYERPFQAMYLTQLAQMLQTAPTPLTWVVVEAGGPTPQTRALLSGSGVAEVVHLAAPDNGMPDVANRRRRQAEDRLREYGLQYIKEKRMEGVVTFVDDSNIISLTLFDELQSVKWFSAFPLGFLMQRRGGDPTALPVQAPACDSSQRVIGWYVVDHDMPPLESAGLGGGQPGRRLVGVNEGPQGGRILLEWTGFALNARALWAPEERPLWMNEWRFSPPEGKVDVSLGDMQEEVDSSDLLGRLVVDESKVETLGKCGGEVHAWWLRGEAAFEGKYPVGWSLDQQLPVVAKPKQWSEEQWVKYEATVSEAQQKGRNEKKKKKKGGKKKKKKVVVVPEEPGPEVRAIEPDMREVLPEEGQGLGEVRVVPKSEALQEVVKKLEEQPVLDVKAEISKVEAQVQQGAKVQQGLPGRVGVADGENSKEEAASEDVGF